MQGSNLSLLCLLHCRQMLYHLSHQGEASYIIDKASLSNLLLLLSHFSCDPKDGSPLGSPVPGILQAITLAWVAMSFSNA